MRTRNVEAAKEARQFIETCLFDLSDPQASFKRKRRAKAWLGYWATELEHIVNDGRARPFNRPAKRATV